MTTMTQELALWEMLRQGHQTDAADSEKAWAMGKEFIPASVLTRHERAAVDLANFELANAEFGASGQWPGV